MPSRSSILALGLAVLLPAAARGQSATPEQVAEILRGPARVVVEGTRACAPITGPDYLPLVETTVNGKGPFPLLLDFGSNVTLLRQDVADSAGVDYELVRPGADLARVRSMGFGGLEAEDLLVGVYRELDVAGVVGFPFFRDHALRLDFPGREICVFDGARPMKPGGDVVPLIVDSQIPYVDVRIGDRALRMFLDTGASDWFSFPSAWADSLALEADPVPGPTLTNNQAGNTRISVARLRDDLALGPVRVERPEVFFDPAVDRPFLGQSLLKRFVVTIDRASGAVRFEGDHSKPVEVPDHTTFGVALGFRGGEVRVIDRVPGTPAERLVPAGARVTRVNGIAAGDLTELEWRNLRLTADRLDLEIEVGGGTRTVTLERWAIARPPDDPSVLAIRDVRVWDGTGRAPAPGSTVVVRDDRIAAVGPADSVAIPAGATVVEGAGRTLIPGLWDSHVHALWGPKVPETFFPLFLVHGITAVRDMGGKLAILAKTRRDLAAGRLLGPRLAAAAGNILDGPDPIQKDVSIAVGTPAGGRAAVDSMARAGADFIKVYTLLPADAFRAIVEEAARDSLPVAGHVPAAVGPIAAARAGLVTIEHMMAALGGFCDPRDRAACGPIFAALKENGTRVVPTLVIRRKQTKAEMRRDPRLRYLPPAALDLWFGDSAPAHPESLPVTFLPPAEPPPIVELARVLHRAKIPLLAGSDAGVPFSFPGWSLHEELELLVDAGLTPAEALESATRAPAETFGRPDLGTIQVGKRADLVLLRGNPLEDIRNTRRIEAVVLDGRLFDRDALDATLRRVERIARGGRATGTLASYVEDLVGYGFSGAILVMRDGEVLLQKGYGTADEATGAAVTDSTLFYIASVSKQFTAAAVVRLIGRGALRPGDTLGDFFPQAPPDKAGITIHQLLTHTSGLAEYISKAQDRVTREEALRRALSEPLRFEPGAEYGYSNAGYVLLAMIVEKVSGLPFPEFMRRELFEPAGMTDTILLGESVPGGKVAAHGYTDGADEGDFVAWSGPAWGHWGSGGVVTSIRDMARWERALRGDRVLSPASRALMFTPHVRVRQQSYGYGWRVGSYDYGGPVVYHYGSENVGMNAGYVRFTDAGVTVVVLSNREARGTPFAPTTAVNVARFVLEAGYAGLPDYASSPKR